MIHMAPRGKDTNLQLNDKKHIELNIIIILVDKVFLHWRDGNLTRKDTQYRTQEDLHHKLLVPVPVTTI